MRPPTIRELPGSVHVLFTTREATAAARSLEDAAKAAPADSRFREWARAIADKIRASQKPERRYRTFPGKPKEEMQCVVCGCTDALACDGGCEWVAADLCSTCSVAWSDAVVLIRKLYNTRNKGWSLDRRTVEAARALRKMQDDTTASRLS